jgi:hypothetical protein
VLPGDVTSLKSGEAGTGLGSAIVDSAGHNALTGLTSIAPQATLSVDEGTLALTGSLVSAGTIDLGSYATAATLSVKGTLTQTQGNLSLQSGSTVAATTVRIDHGAGLSALGTIDGNLINDGSVGPAYHLSVTGNYTQGADGTLGAGFVPELMVTGKATLAGTLVASKAPPPAPGTRHTAITFASVSGGFTAHSLGFNLASSAHSIDVIAQPQIAATPATVARGGAITINGGDFGLGTQVTLFLDRTNGTFLGTAQPSDQGFITVNATIGQVKPGTHKIIAIGSDGRQAQTTITAN